MTQSNEPSKFTDQMGKAVGSAAHSIGKIIDGLVLPRPKKGKPGSAPGLRREDLEKVQAERRSTGDVRPVRVTCIDYCADWIKEQTVDNFDQFIASHRPDGTTVRWINVDALSDAHVIASIAEKYGLHPLAIEDMVHVPQRSKVDHYDAVGEHHARLFIVAHMIQKDSARVRAEQVSIFLGHNTLITFLEDPGDVWEPIRQRLRLNASPMRPHDVSYLLYTLLDAIVDHCFPILEHYSDRLVRLEEVVMKGSKPEFVHHIYRAKRDLLLLSRQVWPMREVVSALMRNEHKHMSDYTLTYLRDVYDHTIQLIELLESYRELASGLADMHLTVMGHRLNEVMKVLTIIATIFIPITFLAGVYGMNYAAIPELQSRWFYAGFWFVCLAIAGGMLAWFRRMRWL